MIVRLPNWLGDTVMAVPALRALRETLSGAEIMLAGPWAPILAGQGLADVLVARGEADGALAHADRCLDLIGETGQSEHLADIRRIRGLALASKGEFDAAIAELELARAAAQKAGMTAFDAVVDSCLSGIADARAAAR